ncbi:MAG: hypothetical protein JSU04_03095 [Bdellovibrionales bacterium]|nr:hypothetical protein [Bdellovibrionales bacterium]
MKRLFFLLPLMGLLISCATAPKAPPVAPGSLKQAQWDTKAVIRDIKANKSHSVDIEIAGDYPGKLRMDVKAFMGTSVASLALNNDDIRYAIYPQKKFFEGKANEGSFMPLMNVPLHPRNFMSIAYDLPMRGTGWDCKKDPSGLPSECDQASKGVKVQWTDRTPEGQKKVLISGPTFEMRWLFKPPQTEVQFKDETFSLEAPAEFKTIQLK